MDQQCDHRERHLTPADFPAQVLGRAANHLTRQEDTDDQEQQQVDHSDAFSAVDAVQPHSHEGRKARDRIQAVVFAIDRAAGHVNRGRGEGRAGGSSEAQFLTLEIAEMLIDRESSHGRQGDDAFAEHSDRSVAHPG